MRRFSTVVVLIAWLLASGTQWDVLQSFAWGRMIATYSRTMPFDEAVRLTFTPDNLCDVCAFVADARTRADTDADGAPTSSEKLFKAKAPIATPPVHLFVFISPPEPEWPREDFRPDACARPAPPTEPPRAA